jgi:non-heme chloroperoxidase
MKYLRIMTACAILSSLVLFASCAASRDTPRQVNNERSIKTEGVRVTYEKHGNSGVTIIFIHGWTGNRWVWRYQLAEFPEYTVLAIDLPGNGESDKPEGYDYSPATFALDTLRVLDAENVTRAIFVGHSMGFAVCEMIARTAPERCAGIVSVDGARFEIPVEPSARASWNAYVESMAAAITDESGREAFIDALLRPDTPSALRGSILAESRKVPIPVAREMILGVTKHPELMAPATIDIPCLALYTPSYGVDGTYEMELRKTFPNLSYRFIPDTSHWLMLERPYIVTDEIVKFVEKNR